MNAMIRRIAAMAISLSYCIGVYAYDFVAGGVYYNKKSATEAEVTFKDMADNTKAYSGNVVVPETVTHGGYTYRVTSIGQMAFYSTPNLISVTLSEGIEEIGQVAFSFCPKLTSVNIPTSVKEIGMGVFYRSQALTGPITIPEGVTAIPKGTFEGCTNLSVVNLPSTLTEIGEDAFKDCKSLKEIVIPENVQLIDNRAFAGCTSLASATIPSTVQKVDAEAFYNCPNLKIMKGGTSAYAYDFKVNNIYYKKLSPSQVEVTYLHKKHNDHAYAGKVVIPSAVSFEGVSYDVVAIGDNAFERCFKLTSVTIPQSIKRIGKAAFNGCYMLATPQIPSSVKSIGILAFSACTSFTGTITLPEGIDKIEIGTFSFCEKLTGVNLPSTVIIIDENAFQNCHLLENIVIPDKVKSIGAFAFDDCRSLKSINIPYGVVSIGSNAFSKTALSTVTIPESVTQIHYRSFADCKYLGENCSNVILLDKSHRGTVNGYEWVDLGLPSGLKWATCNVGASKPNDYGDYYSWGEVTTKKIYKRVMPGPYAPRNSEISGNPKKDAAVANWGAPWRMPMKDEFFELMVHSVMEEGTMNGVKGMKFISKTNFHFIFIPYAGRRSNSETAEDAYNCFVWSSTPHEVNTYRAYYYDRKQGAVSQAHEYIYNGFSIRPVTE